MEVLAKKAIMKQLIGKTAQISDTRRHEIIAPKPIEMNIPTLYDNTVVVDITPRSFGSLWRRNAFGSLSLCSKLIWFIFT